MKRLSASPKSVGETAVMGCAESEEDASVDVVVCDSIIVDSVRDAKSVAMVGGCGWVWVHLRVCVHVRYCIGGNYGPVVQLQIRLSSVGPSFSGALVSMGAGASKGASPVSSTSSTPDATSPSLEGSLSASKSSSGFTSSIFMNRETFAGPV